MIVEVSPVRMKQAYKWVPSQREESIQMANTDNILEQTMTQ